MHETTLGKALVGGLLCCTLAACSSDDSDSDSDAPSGQGGGTPSGSGGSSGANTGVVPNLPTGGSGGDDEEGPFDSCQDFARSATLNDLPMPTGSAQLSLPATTTRAAVDGELIEIVCEAFHDSDGQVAGFRASFFETWDWAALTPSYAWVRWEGAFAGDGTYEEASFTYSMDSGIASRDTEFETGTLTLSEGGRVGSFTTDGGDTLLTFACGSAAKLSTAAKPPATAEVPPGTLRLWGEDVPVYEFANIECGIQPGVDETFGIDGDVTSPYYVKIPLDGSGTGTHRIDGFVFEVSYAGFTDYSLLGGNVTLECGFPARGTLEFSTQSNLEITGAFTCPE